ncbi:butyrophilin subfamily 1 member A1-like [Tamandua tetradactyla]|uniref:butyrophilin subfamily 1 member A1-like n=1 Tax=Tamandua tetradactyla TaxID=48850 RepID=UPI0040547C6A
MQPSGVGARTLLLSLLLPWPGTGQFLVIGPAHPVVGHVFKEVVFSCRLSPSMDAQGMEVRWFRDQPPFVIHMYQNGQDNTDLQRKEYHGRTEFLGENITQGIVGLRLRGIQVSDEGKYGCMFQTFTFFNEAHFPLQVTGTGSSPHIHLKGGEAHGIRLLCTSSGWYPEPRVGWTDSSGQDLLPLSVIKHQMVNGLFHVETTIVVLTHSEGNVSCFIHNPLLDIKKQARLSVADDLFPKIPVWNKLLYAAVAIMAFFLIGAAFYFWRQHKTKSILNEELERRKLLGEEGLKFAQSYAEAVTLDQNTAHPYLQISENKKSVRGSDVFRDLPSCSKRFDNLVCVLGHQIFFKGRHYWEVSVKEKIRWTLGIWKDSVHRQGELQISPEFGFWALGLNRGNDYQAFGNPRVTLYLEEFPEIVGIFLDFEAGRVSFYNVTNLSHIYTFRHRFRGALRPFFYPGPPHAGQNGRPLTILPVNHVQHVTYRRFSV